MTQPITRPTATGQRKPARRSRGPALLTLGLLFAIVTTALAGCIVVPVPVGWGHGHYYRHGYYRGDRR